MNQAAEHHNGREFIVSPELANAAERLGVQLHAGDRVRFEVIEGGGKDSGPASHPNWPPAWVGSITTDEGNLGARAREIMRAELSR